MRNLLLPFLASQQILLVEPSLQAGGLKKTNNPTHYSQIWIGVGNEYQIRFRHLSGVLSTSLTKWLVKSLLKNFSRGISE
jgi:hypothetical protein